MLHYVNVYAYVFCIINLYGIKIVKAKILTSCSTKINIFFCKILYFKDKFSFLFRGYWFKTEEVC